MMADANPSLTLTMNLREDFEEPTGIDKVRKGGDALTGHLEIHAERLDYYHVIVAFEGQ